MTNEEIIRTAKELSMRHNADIFELDGDGLIAFAALIAAAERNRIADEAQYIIKRAEARGAAAERESCAALCESRHANGSHKYDHREECAKAIREKGAEQ